MKKEKKITKSFCISKELSDEFEKLAKDEGLTRSCLFRKILKIHFEEKRKLYK